MALVFRRTLAIPLWTIVFFTVAFVVPPPATLFLTPPTNLFVVAVVGIALIVFTVPSAIAWLRTSRSLARVNPSTYRHKANTGSAMAAGICVRTPDEPDWRAAEDVLDLVRMDDDGGWQRARPPA